QTNSLQQLPVTLTLKTDKTEVNYPRQITYGGGFFTVPVDGLAGGTYNWQVKGSNGRNGGARALPQCSYGASLLTSSGGEGDTAVPASVSRTMLAHSARSTT